MSPAHIVFSILAATLSLSVLLLFFIKFLYRRENAIVIDIRKNLTLCMREAKPFEPRGYPIRTLLMETIKINEEVRVPEPYLNAIRGYARKKIFSKTQRRLRSRDSMVRSESAILLSLFPGEDTERALLSSLDTERSQYCLLQICYSLMQLHVTKSLPSIITLMRGKEPWFYHRVIEILLNFGQDLENYLCSTCAAEDELSEEEVALRCAYVRRFPNNDLLEELETQFRKKASLEIARVLLDKYPYILAREDYLSHPDKTIRGMALEALGSLHTEASLERLLQASADPVARPWVISGLRDCINHERALLERLFETCETLFKATRKSGRNPTDFERYKTVALLLLPYFEYFMYADKNITCLVHIALSTGKLSDITTFLETNRNEKYETDIVDILKKYIALNPKLGSKLAEYISDEALLTTLSLHKAPEPERKPALKLDKNEKASLWVIAGLVILLPLIAGTASYFAFKYRIIDLLVHSIRFFTKSISWYYLAINALYCLLIVLSALNIKKQLKSWNLIRNNFMGLESMLPSVSILAPAYREELTIVDSVKSLLSLNYPKSEVIVICDGSPDLTLSKLIEAFRLERTDRHPYTKIPSRQIRGFYASPEYPYLLVIDKLNGGKADSLNAGLNFAKNDYICCIDADSLLERDALLRIMHHVISSDREMTACGGNIMPVNGCKVESGALTSIHIPKNTLARFQTIEYFRAFLSGRLGWSMLNSLLIISGAFGVFKRQRVLEINGYLTGSASGKMDTVGEDMELVVRLRRAAHEQKRKTIVSYCYNANCWTEVPEDWGSFARQRDRWHRGLLEILMFHRKCLFKPMYGSMGTIAMPYFWIFECIGPFFELFGLLLLAAGIAAGLLTPGLIILYFAASILFGMTISAFSLIFIEFRIVYFGFAETLTLLFFSILENFGYRQIVAIKRVFSYFRLLLGEGGWGAIRRKGFKK